MKALIVYYSKFGNTQKIAEAIAAKLAHEADVVVMRFEELASADLQDADLIVVGSPTQQMSLPQPVRDALAALPPDSLRDTPTAAFDTSHETSEWLAWLTAANKLERRLAELGGRPIVQPETFHVMEREGPLEEGELERARLWVDLILEALRAHPSATT
jgi:flavodoxin